MRGQASRPMSARFPDTRIGSTCAGPQRPSAPVCETVHRHRPAARRSRARRDRFRPTRRRPGGWSDTPPGVPVTSPLSLTSASGTIVDARRLAAGDEFIDLAERARMKRGLAMIERAEHEIGRALQRRAFGGDAGRRARLADEAAVGLRIFVDAVAAQA